MKKHTISRLCPILIFLLAAGSIKASSLVQNSPFLPPSYKKASSTSNVRKSTSHDVDTKRFILKGISKIGSDYFFSVYDSVTDKGEWLQAGVSYNGFSILQYDPSEKSISFSWKGKTHRIKIKKPNGEPIGLFFRNDDETSTEPYSIAGGAAPKKRARIVYAPEPGSSNILAGNQRLPVSFEQRINTTNTTSSSTGQQGELFAAIDTASTLPNGDIPQPNPSRRYQVSRSNTVHNPGGRKPDHLTLEQFNKL